LFVKEIRMDEMRRMPGGALAKRPLHFILLLDASGSMSNNGKIQSLNTAIRETIPVIQEVADRNPGVEVLIRAIRFADQPAWHIAQAIPIRDFTWQDIAAGGETAMGKALEMVASVLTPDEVGRRALPPVLLLVSDGFPTDDFAKGMRAVMSQPWGKQAVRLGVAIGQDANEEVLRQFIGVEGIPPMRANNPEMLVECIRLVSRSAVESSSTRGESRDQRLMAELAANAPGPRPGSVW
jgi:uncharacterized protein YegL